MKKFFKEFKEFALKGSFLELAVAVVLGAAFKEVVDALVRIFLEPIVTLITNAIQAPAGSALVAALMEFLFVVIKFILIAFMLFLIIKAFNKAKNARKKGEDAPAEPTTKVCPFCKSEIDIEATRCPHCTSELK